LTPFLLQQKEVQMNKTELVKRVAEKLGDMPKKTAAKAVDAVFQSIQEGLKEDGIVKIGQWGTYTLDDIQ
jgi:nucleoid DNA-binding protein